MKLTRPLREFVAAVYSPLHDDGSIAPEIVPIEAAFLALNGITTVFITGTTGECHSLSCSEKLALYDAWAQAGPANGIAVIAHVGGNSLEDARLLARRARALDLAAISTLPPSYYKPVTLETVIDWCAAIAADAPDLPFYYYDIPMLTGVSVPIEQFLVDAADRIPNLAGVKFTNPDLVSYRRCLDVAGERFDLPWGIDEALLAGLATGASAGVGSTYNFAPKLSFQLLDAFNRGDIGEARRLQSIAVALVDAVASTGYLGTTKALMTRLGVPVGPARLPLSNPPRDQFESVFARLLDLGFEEWGATAR
jgi:N-acetylneuraminate lyase